MAEKELSKHQAAEGVIKPIEGEAWDYLENMFINSIVLRNCKLQLHILSHGAGRYNQVDMQHTRSELKGVGGQMLGAGVKASTKLGRGSGPRVLTEGARLAVEAYGPGKLTNFHLARFQVWHLHV